VNECIWGELILSTGQQNDPVGSASEKRAKVAERSSPKIDLMAGNGLENLCPVGVYLRLTLVGSTRSVRKELKFLIIDIFRIEF
jgi:hypothetical protein